MLNKIFILNPFFYLFLSFLRIDVFFKEYTTKFHEKSIKRSDIFSGKNKIDKRNKVFLF